MNAKPYKKMADAKLPRMKYLNAASFESFSSLLTATSKYKQSDIISMAIKVTIKSFDHAKKSIPTAALVRRNKNSENCLPEVAACSMAIMAATPVNSAIRIQAKLDIPSITSACEKA